MLSKKIELLYELLRCNNSVVARFAGCSPSNFSHMKRGKRTPGQNSHTIRLFSEGVYAYAAQEQLLDTLSDLCGSTGTDREILVPALIKWLCDEREVTRISSSLVQPKSIGQKDQLRKNFGERLNLVMNLLDLSNHKLSVLLNIDPSLISRYRRGLLSPHSNETICRQLTETLFDYARSQNKMKEIARLCTVEKPDVISFRHFLFDLSEESASLAGLFLSSLDTFSVKPTVPKGEVHEILFRTAGRYWGTEGLRNAVLRFLNESDSGDELMLYSDEPMDWMTSDPKFFSLWSSLMKRCTEKGVCIRIIHNTDRNLEEMVAAISGWFPLYISGQITPYVFPREHSARFCHTCFLRRDKACVTGTFPVGSGEQRWYDYITDKKQLEAMAYQYDHMLKEAVPFMKTYTAFNARELQAFCRSYTGEQTCLLNGLPGVAAPEELLQRILSRSDLTKNKQNELLSFCRRQRSDFLRRIKKAPFTMLLSPESYGIDFSILLKNLDLKYTEEEYRLHIEFLKELADNNRNFSFIQLPDTLFSNTALIALGESVVVLRTSPPQTAFVFTNNALARSVSQYLNMLRYQQKSDE